MRPRSAGHDSEFAHVKSTWRRCSEARLGSLLTRQLDGLFLSSVRRKNTVADLVSDLACTHARTLRVKESPDEEESSLCDYMEIGLLLLSEQIKQRVRCAHTQCDACV